MCKKVIVIVFLISLSNFINKSTILANLCKDISNKSVDLQLKTYLFCDYDANIRPESNKINITSVELIIMPKMIEFDDMTNTLYVHCWTAMNWTDPFLIWDPDDFDGLNALHILSSDIWVPDITIHNSGDMSDDEKGIPETNCGLNSNGGIICIPAIKYIAHCDADYTHYPYDIQNCTIELASWSYTSEEIYLLLSYGVLTADFTQNKEWKILNSTITHEVHDFKMNDTYNTLIYIIQFLLQRRDAGIHTVYIVPAIILMVMTLSVLWLDYHSSERMVIACLSFICHLISVQDLYSSIPHNGAILPNIIKFYENSFLLMGCTLILTVLLREVGKLSASPPEWITSITFLILQSKVGKLILMSILNPKTSTFPEISVDDRITLMHANKKNLTWNFIILLFSWFAFISVFLTYTIMLAIFLPTKDTII